MSKKTLITVAVIAFAVLCVTGGAVWYFMFRSTPKKALANISAQVEKIDTLKGTSEAYYSLKTEIDFGEELYLTYENTTKLEIEDDLENKLSYILLEANDQKETNDPDESTYDDNYNSTIYIDKTDFYVKNEGDSTFTQNSLGSIRDFVTLREDILSEWFKDRWNIWKSISDLDIDDLEVSTEKLDGKTVYRFILTDVKAIDKLSEDLDIYYMKEYFESEDMDATVSAKLTFWLLKDGTPYQRELTTETIGTSEDVDGTMKMTYKTRSVTKISETNVSVEIELPD